MGLVGSFGRPGGFAERLTHGRHQPIHVVGIPGVVDRQRVAPGQRAQALRQLSFGRHRRAVDQYGDDARRAGEPCGHLAPHEVSRVFNARRRAVTLAPPAPADQHQQDRGRADFVLDDLRKSLPGLDVVDIDEHPIGAEMRRQFIADGARIPSRVVTAIADEHLGGAHSRR